jgi:hypothetical protein
MANNRPESEHQAAIERTRLAVGRYASAWLAGDRAALAACYHNDFTLHYFGHNPLAGDHAGKVGALGILAEVTRRTNRKLLAIVDVMARCWSASALSATAGRPTSSACWCTPCATDCFPNAGSTTRIRRWSMRS